MTRVEAFDTLMRLADSRTGVQLGEKFSGWLVLFVQRWFF